MLPFASCCFCFWICGWTLRLGNSCFFFFNLFPFLALVLDTHWHDFMPPLSTWMQQCPVHCRTCRNCICLHLIYVGLSAIQNCQPRYLCCLPSLWRAPSLLPVFFSFSYCPVQLQLQLVMQLQLQFLSAGRRRELLRPHTQLFKWPNCLCYAAQLDSVHFSLKSVLCCP